MLDACKSEVTPESMTDAATPVCDKQTDSSEPAAGSSKQAQSGTQKENKRSHRKRSPPVITLDNEQPVPKKRTVVWPSLFKKAELFRTYFRVLSLIANTGEVVSEVLRGVDTFLAAKKVHALGKAGASMSKAVAVLEALEELLDHPPLSLSDESLIEILSRKRVNKLYEKKLSRREGHEYSYKLIHILAYLTL